MSFNLFTLCCICIGLIADFNDVCSGKTVVNPEAGIDTLLHLHKLFYLEDVDDDGFVEIDDLKREVKRSDSNKDGVWSYEELSKDPDLAAITETDFKSFDLNGDGKVDLDDAEVYFTLVPGGGNDINLEEYLILQGRRVPVKGALISIKAFVHAEKDYKLTDKNDDFVLTNYEYTVEFQAADSNGDGKLIESEVYNFIPTRSIPPKNVCQNVQNGCSLDDVKKLFTAADTNSDTKLSQEEYIRYFGHLIDI